MKKILVVDDNQDILHLLKTRLRSEGFNVRTSTTCDEGLDIFYAFAPDLVIMDVNVGEADGRALCRTIKSRAEHQHIPVLLVSADPDNLTDWREYGAHAAIQKPFQLTALVADIRAALVKT